VAPLFPLTTYDTLQHTATHCTHIATQCNTVQHTANTRKKKKTLENSAVIRVCNSLRRKSGAAFAANSTYCRALPTSRTRATNEFVKGAPREPDSNVPKKEEEICSSSASAKTWDGSRVSTRVLKCVAVCCSVLLFVVAVCCRGWQCGAVRCSGGGANLL
jgi:hypothetical protein